MKISQLIIASVSLALLVCFSGCGTDSQTAGKDDSSTHAHGEGTHADGSVHKDHNEEGHAHGPGPHDGTIADWGGGKFHVEFTVDHDKQEATVYILGSDERTTVPIDASEISLTIKEPSLTTSLKASPMLSDPEGKASRFVGTHKGLGVVREYEGSISGVVDGTPYSGNFSEEAHDH